VSARAFLIEMNQFLNQVIAGKLFPFHNKGELMTTLEDLRNAGKTTREIRDAVKPMVEELMVPTLLPEEHEALLEKFIRRMSPLDPSKCVQDALS
jgi:hypothetical protein